MRSPMKVALLAAVVLALLVATGLWTYAHRPQAPAVRNVKVVFVLSPEEGVILHDELARELASGFEEWYYGNFGSRVRVELAFEGFGQLEREFARGTLDFDVLLAGTLDLIEGYEDLFVPYNSTEKEELLGLVPNGTYYNCPIMEPDVPTPRWYAWCLYAPCLLYDPSAIGPSSLPSNWDELAEFCLRLENKVVVPDTTGDPYSKGVAVSIYAYEAWALGNESLGWARAWNNSVFIWASSGNMTDEPWVSALEVVAGRYAVVLCPDIIAYHMVIEAGYSWLAIRHLNGTFLSPCPMAIRARPGRTDLAKAFLDFVLSEEGQSIVARYVMPIRPDVEARDPVVSPFSPGFPVIKEFNETFLDMASGIIRDYHACWLVKPYRALRRAFWWVKKANETRLANENATKYYRWALGNFTYMADYLNRTHVDQVYNQTGNWTDKAVFLRKWEDDAKKAYNRAVECAMASVESAKTAGTGAGELPVTRPGASCSRASPWPTTLRQPHTAIGPLGHPCPIPTAPSGGGRIRRSAQVLS